MVGKNPFTRKRRIAHNEREKIVRIEKAEEELQDLQKRAHRAIKTLDERQRRNGFAEALRATMTGPF